MLALAATYFWLGGGPWPLFALLFFAPDLSFLGYLAGPRVGALAYNVAHTYVSPVILGMAALLAARAPRESAFAITGSLVAAVWFAHIGFDRALGYGLKYPSAFHDTHLGRIGR